MTVCFYFSFTVNDCAKNIKIQTRKSAPTFRTSFWAISPAWTELLICKRKLKIFKIQDFPPCIFLKAISALGCLPGLCHVGMHHSPYTRCKCWTLGHTVFLDATLIMTKLGCRILHFLSDLVRFNAYKLSCRKISVFSHIILLYPS